MFPPRVHSVASGDGLNAPIDQGTIDQKVIVVSHCKSATKGWSI